MAVKPIPDGYHTVTPYLAVEGAHKLLDFVTRAFDAKEISRSTRPDGTVWHAEIQIGDSRVMLAEAAEPWKPMPTGLYLYVKDVDATFKKAIAAGGTSIMEPADQFYGDRHGGVQDPVGNLWWVATHVEDVPPEEMERRMKAAAKERADGELSRAEGYEGQTTGAGVS